MVFNKQCSICSSFDVRVKELKFVFNHCVRYVHVFSFYFLSTFKIHFCFFQFGMTAVIIDVYPFKPNALPARARQCTDAFRFIFVYSFDFRASQILFASLMYHNDIIRFLICSF